MKENKVAIIGGVRIPFSRSFSHYWGISNLEMLTFVLDELAKRYGLEGKQLGDVCLGVVYKHASDFGIARETVIHSTLSNLTPGVDTQRACGTSLEASLNIANKIRAGQIEVGIAGGSDTNSDIPLEYSRKSTQKFLRLNKAKSWGDKLKALAAFRVADFLPAMPGIREPSTGLLMGEHCELMAKEWNIPREDQDDWALKSHQNATKAYENGFYEDLVVPFKEMRRDGGVRKDTSEEKLAALPPAFDKSGVGTLSAGNSSPLSDGASAALFASEKYAKENALAVQAYFVDGQVEAVDFPHGEGLLMAPTVAVSNLLQRHGLKLQDFDFYEIHEAFAAQVLCTLKAWQDADYCRKRLGRNQPLGEIDLSKVNVCGGSVALGHPFAATGTRLVACLAKLLAQKGKGRGLISVCTAGGMGVAAILER